MKRKVYAALLLCGLLCAGCGRRADSDSSPVQSVTGSASGSQTVLTEPAAETTSAADSTAAAAKTGTSAAGGSSTAEQTSGTTQSAQSVQTTGSTAAAQTQTARNEKKLAAAKEKCDRLLTAALDQQRAAEQAYQSYSAEHQPDLDRYGQGSLGFFSFVGAEDAVKVLKTAKYASATKLGTEQDATSLSNMEKSFDLMRECNQLRAKHGLKPLVVTDRLMAIAQSNLNWSDGKVAHSQQFQVGENLSWNYKDPFTGWYDDEKAENGGHYRNIINEDYVTTGFAVCTAGRSGKYSVSHGQVFSFSAEQTFTVDQYEKRFRSYFDSISKIRKELEQRRSDADSKKKRANTLSLSLEQKQAAITKAETAYQKALAEYESLGGSR